MKNFAEVVAYEFMRRFEPELHKAIVEQIISKGAERWIYRFSSDRTMSDAIDAGIESAMKHRYAPVIEYIANKKAREKAIARAKANGISQEELAGILPGIFGDRNIETPDCKTAGEGEGK
jgi:uncharacterized protein (DUF362 family)